MKVLITKEIEQCKLVLTKVIYNHLGYHFQQMMI